MESLFCLMLLMGADQVHDKCIGSGGNSKGSACPSWLGPELSIPTAFAQYYYGAIGTRLAPLKSIATLGGKAEKNWNKTHESTTKSSVNIGGGSYVNGNLSEFKQATMYDPISNKWNVPKVYGREGIKTGDQQQIAKYNQAIK